MVSGLDNQSSSGKYPRTLHLPFSPEVHSDDKVCDLIDLKEVLSNDIVITEKLDGGNTCLDSNGVFARSHSETTKCPTFDYIKNVHYFPKKHLMKDYRFFGENLYAIHSIIYDNLEDYFYLFNISKGEYFLSMNEVKQMAEKLGFTLAPILFEGRMNEKELFNFCHSEIKKSSLLGREKEGFVIRPKEGFLVSDFTKKVFKFVRKGHVQSDEHWSLNWQKNTIKKVKR